MLYTPLGSFSSVAYGTIIQSLLETKSMVHVGIGSMVTFTGQK